MSDNEEPTDLDNDEEQAMLADLKNRAKAMGMSFHPSIKADALRTKMAEYIQMQEQQNIDNAMEEAKAQKELLSGKMSIKEAKNHALKLNRCIISCLDPMKRNYQAEMFLAGNSVIGSLRVCIPFGKEWHVANIILNFIKDKHYTQFSTKRVNGQDINETSQHQAYGIQMLPMLTEKELHDLKQRQLMQQGKEAA